MGIISMDDNDFNILKKLIEDTNKKVDGIVSAFQDFQLTSAKTLSEYDKRLTMVEKYCLDDDNDHKRFWDYILKIIPIIITVILLILTIKGKQ